MTLREHIRFLPGDWTAPLLILVNLLPLAGIFFLGWTPASVMALYWLETLIIGAWNYPKIFMTEGHLAEKIFVAIFFAVHFGMFNYGHFTFLREFYDIAPEIDGLFNFGVLFWTGLIFVISHGLSFFVNFIGRQEYAGRKPNEQMFYPYGRVIVLHVSIILAGAFILLLGDLAGVVVLIAVKTVVDLIIHNVTHGPKKSIMEP